MDVSIVICTYNRADKLHLALEALLGMKTEREWEAVILDNASTDHTRQVIEDFAQRDPHIRYAFEGEQGLGAARDTAWRLTKGRIVSLTDDDCYVAPDYVDRICEVFEDRPELGFVGGKILLHNPNDARITIDMREEPAHIPAYSYVEAGTLHGANLSFRREVLETVDGFSRNMGAGTPYPCEDIDVIARAVWSGAEGGYDPRPTVSHDHGRKKADVPKLMEGYDRGGAAYFARFLLRPDTRAAYRKGMRRQLQNKWFKRAWPLWKAYFVTGNRFIRNEVDRPEYLRFNFELFSALLLFLVAWARRKITGVGMPS